MNIIKMFEFMIGNIFFMFGGCVFRQTVNIYMGTNCASLLADLFLYSDEAKCMHGLLLKNEKEQVQSFNFTLSYTDGVLSLNNF